MMVCARVASQIDSVQARPTSAYAREIRPLLSREHFAPARSRLLWIPVHVSVLVCGAWLLSAVQLPWFAWPLISVVMGCSFAGMTFLGHETLHGAIVRGKALRRVIGWLGFLPFVVSPRLWEAWHNRVHHNHTNEPGVDPDAYPTLEEYQQNRAVRAVTELAPGRKRLTGAFSLLVGFSVQSLHMLLDARRRKWLKPPQHTRAIAETLLGVGFWSTVAVVLGPLVFLFAYALPLIVANVIVMSFILTNHSLSPHTQVNDPLLNSLSVTGPRWFEWLTLGFGYHVEHHLFPAMSTRHAPALRDILRSRWPTSYQSLPLLRALRALHRSARVYETQTTLVDPKTGRRWQTLTPKAA
jgi:fatty acid desaturase